MDYLADPVSVDTLRTNCLTNLQSEAMFDLHLCQLFTLSMQMEACKYGAAVAQEWSSGDQWVEEV